MEETAIAPNELAQLEILCEAFYGGDPKTQGEAHNVLLPLLNHHENVSKLQCILAKSNQPQALLFACSGLLKLFTQSWSHILESDKRTTRDFLLSFLYVRGPEMLAKAPVILGHFVRLLCRLVKLMWLENVANQNIVEQVRMFMTGTTPQWVLGLEIYTALTEDMQPTMGAHMSRHRRIAISFRDGPLPEIIKVAIDTISQFLSGTIQVPVQQDETRLLRGVLKLTVNCLSFDFMGTVPDDTTDEQSTIMIPHNWSFLRQQNIPKMFFDLYELCWSSPNPRDECAQLCLSALVLIAALRRSFFTLEEERYRFLSELVSGTANIISSKIGLQHDGCYHDLCRLLGKINAANQLSELLDSKPFTGWITQVFSFTMNSLEDWRHLPNSKHYLLGLWSHMVTPLFFLKDKAPSFIADFIEKITLSYINSRMTLAEVVANEGDDADFENPLVHEVLRSEQLEVLSQLGRCKFCSTAERINELFTACRNDIQIGAISQAIFKEKITWLVYMVGCMIASQSSMIPPGSTARHRLDPEGFRSANGQMVTNVFRLMDETNKYPLSSENLELAYLYFLEQFRKVYIGEHIKIISQTEPANNLAESLGLPDGDAVLDLLINKIGLNLQNRSESENIVKKTLQLLHDLANGINIVHCSDRSPHLIVSAKLLLKSNTVKYILSTHGSLAYNSLRPIKYGKYRTLYYFTLAKLVFMEVRDNVKRFEEFLEPQQNVHEELWGLCGGGTSVQALRTDACKIPLIGLVRDLRGICMACNATEPYMLLFDWLVNSPRKLEENRIHLFTWAADVWWDDADVIVPLLKFMSECVHNKAQRITFSSSSANGILLFKEVSSILLTYGNRILERKEFSDTYRQKYKGLAVALDMFSHALNGNYVNFGVFNLYGDVALNDALSLALQMCIAIPDRDLQAYTKSLKPYYNYLDLVTKSFMPQVLQLSPEQVATLLKSIEDGLCSFDSQVCMQCCSTLENVVSYFYKPTTGAKETEAIENYLAADRSSLKRIFQLLFQLILTGESSSTWSLSRPLLGLILLYPSDYEDLKTQLLNQQTDKEKRQKIENCFEELMNNVQKSLHGRNKDLFTRNLYHFSSVIRTILI